MSIDAPIKMPEAGPEPEGASEAPPAEARAGAAARPRRPVGISDVLWFLPRLVLRLLFPKLVDRYVIGELLGPLVFGWTIFIVLFVISVYLFRLMKLVAAGAPLPMVTEIIALRIILSSSYCLPMAVLLAGLMAFGRLSGDSELVAMQAGGIRNLRVVRNAFILGLVLSFAGLAINEYVIPPAGRRLHQVQDQVKAMLAGKLVEELTDQKAFVIQDFEQDRLARVAIARKLEPASPGRPVTMHDVTYMQYDTEREGSVQFVVEADRAEYVGRDEASRHRVIWNFVNARTQVMADYTDGNRWRFTHEKMAYTLNKTPERVSRDQKDADQMTYGELKAHIDDLKKSRVRRSLVREMEVEMERKLSVPFAALVLAMIGAPLGIRKQRSTAGVGIGLSLLIIMTYYMGMGSLGVLGTNGVLEPLVAAWGCNVAGLLVGLFLTWRSS
jgi:lipopolysaccharide export system permease protein